MDKRRFADARPMRALVAAGVRRALTLAIEARQYLRRLEVRDLVGLP